MEKAMIIYSTSEGHTRKIAEALAGYLGGGDLKVDIHEAARVPKGADPASYSWVFVLASVHAGSYQASTQRWVREHSEALGRARSAFISVCLGILEKSEKTDRALGEIMERFFESTCWRPDASLMVAGALSFSRYGWFKRTLLRRLAAYEYTDWKALEEFGLGLIRWHASPRIEKSPPRHGGAGLDPGPPA